MFLAFLKLPFLKNVFEFPEKKIVDPERQ